MKSTLFLTLCVAAVGRVASGTLASCPISTPDSCPLFALGSDRVSAQDLLDRGVLSDEWFELYIFDINSEYTYGKCRQRWRTRYSSDIVRRQTACYNIDLDRCETHEWNITFIDNSCGRAMEYYGENSPISRVFYSQDVDSYVWFHACYSYTDTQVCNVGYFVLIVKDSRILDNGNLQLTGLPWHSISADLKNNFDLDFTNPDVRFVWNGPECGFDGNRVYTLNGAVRAGFSYLMLLCVSLVTLTCFN